MSRPAGADYCGAWIPVCICAEHGWVSRAVCILGRFHHTRHRFRLGYEWDITWSAEVRQP